MGSCGWSLAESTIVFINYLFVAINLSIFAKI